MPDITLCTSCHHHSDLCIKIGSDESHFNISFIVRDKVTLRTPLSGTCLLRKYVVNHCLEFGTKSQDSVHRPQLLKRKDREPKRGIEPKSSIYQPDALPLDQTGSRSKTGEFEVNASSITSTETVRIIRDGEPRRPLRLSHSSRALLTFKFSVALRPHRPSVPTVRDGEPRTAEWPSGCYGQE